LGKLGFSCPLKNAESNAEAKSLEVEDFFVKNIVVQ